MIRFILKHRIRNIDHDPKSEKAWNVVNHTIKGGWNVITNTGNYTDDNGHSSHVAGSVCGYSNNSLGITGASWSCSLYGVKFLAANGSGSLFDAIKAIDWAISQNVRIINASFGGGGYSQPLYDAIKRARDAG